MADNTLTPEQETAKNALLAVENIQSIFAKSFGTALGTLRRTMIVEIGVGTLGGLVVGALVGALASRRKPG